MADLTTVGGRLQFARSQKRLKQVDVATIIGVSHVRVSQWENNVHVPNSENLNDLADLYGVAQGWILRGGGTPMVTENVSRGTYAEGVERAKRIERFEREMVRLGADDFEADHARERARSFIESIHSAGGTDVDEELETYLEYSLRPWILKRIDQRRKRGEE